MSAAWPSGTCSPEAGRRPMSCTSMRVRSLRCSSTRTTKLAVHLLEAFLGGRAYSTQPLASSAIEFTVVPPTKRPTLIVVLARVGQLERVEGPR